MKTTLTYTFDEEDQEAFKIQCSANGMNSAIWNALQLIRAELKYNAPDEKTVTVLEKIREELSIEGVE